MGGRVTTVSDPAGIPSIGDTGISTLQAHGKSGTPAEREQQSTTSPPPHSTGTTTVATTTPTSTTTSSTAESPSLATGAASAGTTHGAVTSPAAALEEHGYHGPAPPTTSAQPTTNAQTNTSVPGHSQPRGAQHQHAAMPPDISQQAQMHAHSSASPTPVYASEAIDNPGTGQPFLEPTPPTVHTVPSAMKILVSNNMAGSIIGRSGQTISELQSQSSSRIKLSQSGDCYPGTSERVCLIQGQTENVKIAVGLILRKLYVLQQQQQAQARTVTGETGAESFYQEQFSEEISTGAPTGQGEIKEVDKDETDAAGAETTSQSESHGRSIGIPPSATASASQDDGSGSDFVHLAIRPAQSAPTAVSTSHPFVVRILVPTPSCGMLIGRGGSNIKYMVSTSGVTSIRLSPKEGGGDTGSTSAAVPYPTTSERIVTITGPNYGSCVTCIGGILDVMASHPEMCRYINMTTSYSRTISAVHSALEVVQTAAAPDASGGGPSVSARTSASAPSSHSAAPGGHVQRQLSFERPKSTKTSTSAASATSSQQAQSLYSDGGASTMARGSSVMGHFPSSSAVPLAHRIPDSRYGAPFGEGGEASPVLAAPTQPSGGGSYAPGMMPLHRAQSSPSPGQARQQQPVYLTTPAQPAVPTRHHGQQQQQHLGGESGGTSKQPSASSSVGGTGGSAAATTGDQISGSLQQSLRITETTTPQHFRPPPVGHPVGMGIGGLMPAPFEPVLQHHHHQLLPQQQHQQLVHGTTSVVQLAIPDGLIGAILGRGGRTLTELQLASNTQIQISQRGAYVPGTRDRLVTVTGPDAQSVAAAQFMIGQRVAAGATAGGLQAPSEGQRRWQQQQHQVEGQQRTTHSIASAPAYGPTPSSHSAHGQHHLRQQQPLDTLIATQAQADQMQGGQQRQHQAQGSGGQQQHRRQQQHRQRRQGGQQRTRGSSQGSGSEGTAHKQ